MMISSTHFLVGLLDSVTAKFNHTGSTATVIVRVVAVVTLWNRLGLDRGSNSVA